MAAQDVLAGPEAEEKHLDKDTWIEYVRQALYMGKVCAYAQGFAQYKMSSELYGWNLPLKDIALIFRGGCIIRADFLNVISEAFSEQPNLANLLIAPYFTDKLHAYQTGLRKVVCEGISTGISFPCLTTALSYYDGYRTGRSNANLLQAQRDYFGAHTYERTDMDGVFHTNWFE